jgi:hypothetical protein
MVPRWLIYLNVWSPIGGPVWEELGDVDLLEEVWTYWRRCGLIGGGVELLEEVWTYWRRCGLIGGGVDLLEEVCHWGWGWGFEVPNPMPFPVSSLSALYLWIKI